MKKTKPDLKVLYLQFREPDMKEQEFECVMRTSGLKRDQFTVIDVTKVAPKNKMLKGHDMLLIGASGSHCVSENNVPNLEEVLELTRAAREQGVPILGLCFGAHIMTVAFGGELENRGKDGQETGTYEITLTEAGKSDPITGRMPEKFDAMEGHKDFMVAVPSGARVLATSKQSPVQAWTFPGESVYALQFHAELDEKGFRERLEYYLDLYVGDDTSELQKIYDDLRPTPEAEKFWDYFIDHVYK